MKQSKKFKNNKAVILFLLCLTSTCSGLSQENQRRDRHDLAREDPTSRYQQKEFRLSRSTGGVNILSRRIIDGTRMTENDSVLGNLYDMRSFRTGSIGNRDNARNVRIDENNNGQRQRQSNQDAKQSIIRNRRLKSQDQILETTKRQNDDDIDSSRQDFQSSNRNNKIRFGKSVVRRQHVNNNLENSRFSERDSRRNSISKQDRENSQRQSSRGDYSVAERRAMRSDRRRHLSEKRISTRSDGSMEDRRQFQSNNQRHYPLKVGQMKISREEQRGFRNNINKKVIWDLERKGYMSTENGRIFRDIRRDINTIDQRSTSVDERRSPQSVFERFELSTYSRRNGPAEKQYNDRQVLSTSKNVIIKADIGSLYKNQRRENCFATTNPTRELSRSDSTRHVLRGKKSILLSNIRELPQGRISEIFKFRNEEDRQNNGIRSDNHFRISFRRVLGGFNKMENEKISSNQNRNRRQMENIEKEYKQFTNIRRINSRDVNTTRETNRIRRSSTHTRVLNRSIREFDETGTSLNERVHRTDSTRLISGSPRTTRYYTERKFPNYHRVSVIRQNLNERVDLGTSPKMDIFFNGFDNRISFRSSMHESMSSKPYTNYPEMNDYSTDTKSAWITLVNTAKIILSIYLIGQIFMDQSSKKMKMRFYKTVSPLSLIKEKVQ